MKFIIFVILLIAIFATTNAFKLTAKNAVPPFGDDGEDDEDEIDVDEMLDSVETDGYDCGDEVLDGLTLQAYCFMTFACGQGDCETCC